MKKAFVIGSLISSALLFSHVGLASDIACTYIGKYDAATQTYNGPTVCSGVTVDDINVHGPLTASRAIFTGSANISGVVHASNSQFDSIDMQDNHSQDKVYLNHNSTVNSDITFQGLKGIVYIDSTSKVLGNIINGDIRKQ